jgi:hypothetical protein
MPTSNGPSTRSSYNIDCGTRNSGFCYSDFGDIFPSSQRLDADIIPVENSKSDMKLLVQTTDTRIAPVLVRVPGDQEIHDRLKAMLDIPRFASCFSSLMIVLFSLAPFSSGLQV